MSNPRLEIQTGGKRRVYQILDDEVLVGSGEDSDVRVVAPGVLARHLRLHRLGRGFRIEPVQRSETVTVNGEEILVKDLTHGDAIELGEATLVYLEHGAAASIAPRSADVTAGTRRRALERHRKDAPNWLLLATVVTIGIGALVLLLRACSSTTWPRSPAHYLGLAREQFSRGAREQALTTLDMVLAEASGDVREQALSLQEEIRGQLREAADLPRLLRAGSDLTSIQSFERFYLQADPGHRPAAREIVRLLDEWQERHGELAARTERGRRLARDVAALRERYAVAADLGQPEQEADVLFAAERQMRLDPRGYIEAVRRLDRYLGEHPDASAVADFRARMLEEGEDWLRRRLRLVDQLIDRRRESDAKSELQKLERFSVLEQWQPLVDQRRKRIGG